MKKYIIPKGIKPLLIIFYYQYMMPKGIAIELGFVIHKGDVIPNLQLIEHSRKPVGLICR